MSLSTVLVGEFWADDGDCDEPDGDRPDERVAGSGCKQDQSNGSRDADEPWSASGVPTGQGLRSAGPGGVGFPEARPAEQSRLPMEQYNARFAKAPFGARDVHRTLVAGHDDLDDAFAWKEERTVSVNLTLQYDQVLFILEPTGIARSLARKRVTVIDYPDGRLTIRYNGVDLPYRT